MPRINNRVAVAAALRLRGRLPAIEAMAGAQAQLWQDDAHEKYEWCRLVAECLTEPFEELSTEELLQQSMRLDPDTVPRAIHTPPGQDLDGLVLDERQTRASRPKMPKL